MTDLPVSKAQLVLFFINNFNNCKKLNTFLFFQCMIVCANIYVLPNLFPIYYFVYGFMILDYGFGTMTATT